MTCGARDGRALEDHWQKLRNLFMAASEGFWNLGTEPGSRVVPADLDWILGWVMEFRTARQARQFLELKGMADADPSGALRLRGANVSGAEDHPGGARRPQSVIPDVAGLRNVGVFLFPVRGAVRILAGL